MNHLKWIVVSFLVVSAVSCKSKKILTDNTVNTKITAKTVIKNHYDNTLDFKTIRGRMKINYSDGSSSNGVSVSLRMEKDKTIWISAPLGIVKAYITPTRVSFYNKLQNEYFDGDFSYLSDILGTDLDFEKVQNVLLGQALFDLKKGKYTADISEDFYELKPKKSLELFKTLFRIEPKHFKITSQQLVQAEKKRLLDIEYKSYQEIDTKILPNEIFITAIDGDNENTIEIDYKGIEFNKPLRFPYKIPKGFKKIILE